MANTTLSDPIRKQNIVDRFEDFVVTHQNSKIVWSANSKPFTQMPNATYAGNSDGRAISITGTSITGDTITSSTLISTLETEAFEYTSIRKQRARLLVTTSAHPYPNPYTQFSQVNTAYMATTNRQTLDSIDQTTVEQGDLISVTGLETYLGDLQREMDEKHDVQVNTDITVCHFSCHTSCHGSRGRR